MNSRMAVRWAKGTSWREVISTPKDDRQVGGWAIEMIDYLQNDDRMFGRILFQQVFEIRGAGAQNHLVGLGVLALIISYNMRCNMRREIEATSVAMVTSQKLFSSLRCLKEATMLVWKSFQRRQNCWSSAMVTLVGGYSAIGATCVQSSLFGHETEGLSFMYCVRHPYRS